MRIRRSSSIALRLTLSLALFALPAEAQTTDATLAGPQARLAQALAADGENSEAAMQAMFTLGRALGVAGRHEEALVMFRRAAASAAKRLGTEHAVNAVIAIDIADQLDDLGRHEQARDVLAPAAEKLAASQGLGDRTTARALELLGGVFSRAGDPAQAQRAWRFAVQARAELHGAASLEVRRNQRSLAGALTQSGQYGEAHQVLREVVEAWRQLPPPDAGERRELTLEWARSHLNVDAPEAALQVLEQELAALRASRVADDDEAIAQVQQQRARALGALNRWADALAIEEQLLARRQRLSGPLADDTLLAIAGVAFDLLKLARYEEAARLQLQVAEQREAGLGAEHLGVQAAWLNFAETISYMGRYAEAGRIQQREIKRLIDKGRARQPMTLNAMNALAGTLYELGLSEESAQLMQQVIDVRTQSPGPDHSDTLSAMHNKAAYMLPTGRHAEALALLQQALARIEAAPAHPLRPNLAYFYRTLGDIHRLMGDRARAEAALRHALALAETDQGPMHSFVGAVLTYLGPNVDDPLERVALFNRALAIGRASNSPEVVWRAADGLREAHAALGQPALAILYGKQAIQAIQAMRKEIGGLGAPVRKAFLERRRDAFTQTAELMIAQGRLVEGRQVLAMLKEDEYHEFVSRSEQSGALQTVLALNPQESAWQQRYQQVGDRLVETARRKAALDARLRRGELSAAEQAMHAQYTADLAAGTAAFAAATRQIADEARRQATEAGAQRLSPETIDAVRSMRGDLRALGHGGVLLHYLMARDRLWILLTTPETQVAREVAITPAALNTRIDALREALRNPRSDALVPARELYRLLLAPVAADLAQADAKTLMLSLDGALRYVPFAALHDGRQYAVETWRFAVLTEAAKTKIKDAPHPQWTMTGLGLTRAVSGFSALPAVREEIAGLVRTGGAGAGVMEGEALFDEAFTLARLRAVLGDPNPVLHIASHFKFTPGTEADSYLVMGDGGHLSLQQICQDDLQFNVDLLTLSACETAVGDNARGQEVEGLGALAQKQGAKAVLATLWPVADASTGIFMREMYRRRADDKLPKAEAIRQVQMAFLSGQIKGGAGAERSASRPGAAPAPAATGYAHPFYWAPFILMGNWL